MRRLPAPAPSVILYSGLVLGLAGLMAALIQGTFSIIAIALCGAGTLLCVLFVILRPAVVRQALRGRQARYGGSAGLMTLAFLTILILLNILASRHSLRWDLTAERAYSVSPQAIQILKSLREPITITGFFLTNDARRERLRDLLEEYRFYTDKLSFEFVDPDLKPALARKYDVTSYGVLVLERGEKRTTTYALDEQELISAIWRLSQEEPQTIYFVTGHGERNPYSFEADGYATIRQTLERNNYIVKTLNLATITDTVPADVSALVLANPTGNFTQQERDHFIDYLYHGGKVLWLIDTNAGMIDPYILSDWDVRVRDDLIIEPRNAFFGEFASPIIDRYPAHAITSGLGGR
ncbi:MAG: Gldg family protein, partial [Anaerolineae bacterium]